MVHCDDHLKHDGLLTLIRLFEYRKTGTRVLLVHDKHTKGSNNSCITVFARFSHNPIQTQAYFTHTTLCRTLMRTEYFLFVHHTTSILAKLSTWCFEHSLVTSVVLYSLTRATMMSPGKDETRVCGYIYIIDNSQ